MRILQSKQVSMKKTNIFFSVAVMLILCSACQKEADIQSLFPETNCVIAWNGDGKNQQNYTIITDIGHKAENCRGCIIINGDLVHLNCQGHGNECRISANMSLNIGGSEIYATTTDTFGLTDQSFFNMPARSLSAEDEKGQPVFLNIPAQLVYRDSSTLQFTFNGLFYSSSAVYSND
jgi:hypothetical protein